VNTVYEEIKEEDKLRRWDYINFARRIRRMARKFVGEEPAAFGFGLKAKIDDVQIREVRLDDVENWI
jgi:hypothetical protein